MRRERRARLLGVRVEELPDGRGRHGNHARGPQNGRWQRDQLLSSEGYVKVRVGRGHPLADPNGYTYEHILVAITALGRPLRDDEVVHHRNGIKTDNRWDNLEVGTRSDHARHHDVERGRDALGRFPATLGRRFDGRKGNHMEAWPEDLRVREMPARQARMIP